MMSVLRMAASSWVAIATLKIRQPHKKLGAEGSLPSCDPHQCCKLLPGPRISQEPAWLTLARVSDHLPGTRCCSTGSKFEWLAALPSPSFCRGCIDNLQYWKSSQDLKGILIGRASNGSSFRVTRGTIWIWICHKGCISPVSRSEESFVADHGSC